MRARMLALRGMRCAWCGKRVSRKRPTRRGANTWCSKRCMRIARWQVLKLRPRRYEHYKARIREAMRRLRKRQSDRIQTGGTT